MSNDLDESKSELFATIEGEKKIDCLYMTPAFDEENNFIFMILLCENYEIQTWGTRIVYDERSKIQANADGEDDPEPPIIDDSEFHYMLHVT